MSIAVQLPEPRSYSAYELKLIQGTYDVMARIGLQQMSLRRTARELDVSPGLLKYHFGDHDKLLIATMTWTVETTVERVNQRLATVQDPQMALEALLDEVFVDAQTCRRFFLISLDLARYIAHRSSFTELSNLLKTQNMVYGAVIRAGVDAGVFDVGDVDRAVFQVRSIVLGGGQQWVQRPDWRKKETFVALRADCHDAIIAILRKTPAGGKRPAKQGARTQTTGKQRPTARVTTRSAR